MVNSYIGISSEIIDLIEFYKFYLPFISTYQIGIIKAVAAAWTKNEFVSGSKKLNNTISVRYSRDVVCPSLAPICTEQVNFA